MPFTGFEPSAYEIGESALALAAPSTGCLSPTARLNYRPSMQLGAGVVAHSPLAD